MHSVTKYNLGKSKCNNGMVQLSYQSQFNQSQYKLYECAMSQSLLMLLLHNKESLYRFLFSCGGKVSLVCYHTLLCL